MISTSTSIKAHCDVAHPRDRVFRHWTSPETRKRWEVGSDTDLSQVNFDMRVGGEEIVEIRKSGQVIGKMIQSVHEFIENELVATTTRYTVEDETTMLMQLALEFSDIEGGTRISALAQVIDLTGANVTDQHRSGWEWIFARFEGDIATNGLIK